MTLLVAAVDGKNIWMVADTAITGGELCPKRAWPRAAETLRRW
jgi:hypothetical protein